MPPLALSVRRPAHLPSPGWAGVGRVDAGAASRPNRRRHRSQQRIPPCDRHRGAGGIMGSQGTRDRSTTDGQRSRLLWRASQSIMDSPTDDEPSRALTIDIDKLTEAELTDLNHRIVERLRFLQQMRAHADM